MLLINRGAGRQGKGGLIWLKHNMYKSEIPRQNPLKWSAQLPPTTLSRMQNQKCIAKVRKPMRTRKAHNW
jgi:hypothetical protein